MVKMMKLSTILLVTTILQTSAAGYGQQVALDEKNASLEAILEQINEQTGYVFFYNAKDLPARPLSLSLRDASVPEALTACFSGLPLTFKIVEKTVVIKRESPPASGDRIALRREQAVDSISGNVTDTTGAALPGVTVQIKGGLGGTATDVDGNFSIVAEETDVLVFSYVGFTTREIPVSSASGGFLQVRLREDRANLEEVVVVGYGTQKKINLTGSVDVVSGEQLQNRSATKVADLIKGASPNLNVTMNLRGGEPGASSTWNIRGMGSVHGNASPLVLVDGVEMNINNVDPASIENISVLKDASASAIYGSRAPFGVILITTKKGQKGERVKIQYNNNIALSSPIKVPSYVDALTWAAAYNQANANAGLSPIYSQEQIDRITAYMNGTFPHEYDPENPIDNIWGGRRHGNANYDWPRILIEDLSFSQKHNLNVSGGGEKTQYYIGGSFVDQDGMYEYGYDYYKRYNFLTNFNAQLTPWLNFHTSLKYAKSETDYPMGETTVGREHFFKEMMTFAPMMPMYNINGTIQSPLIRLMQDAGRDRTENDDLFVTLGGELEPVKGWKTSFSYNYNLISAENARNPKPVWVEVGTGDLGNVGKPSSGYQSMFSRSAYTLVNALTSYEKDLGKHYFKALVGYEQEEKKYGDLEGTAENLISEEIPSISTALGAITLNDQLYHWATQGVFGRINYNFDEKYLLEISARYNGSSRFAKDSRWGFFPAASAGYNISKENFWQGIEPYVNTLKFRASYGALGNQNVDNYLYLRAVPVTSELGWIIGDERPPYANVPRLISNDLTWETITTFNLGLDAGFLDHRLQVVFDWYNRTTTDMLGPSETLPYLLGTTAPSRNNAEMSTRGFELVLSWEDRLSSDFTYNARLSIGDSRSKILKYRNDKGLIGTWYDGKEVGEIWGFITDGIIQTEGEAMPDQSKYHANWGPGDMKYTDLNGDGIIDDGARTLNDHGDLVVIGNTTPRYNIGLTAGFTWKGFDFNMFWQGVGKRDYYPDAGSPLFWGMTRSWGASGIYKNSLNLDYWRPAGESNRLGPNTDAYFAKPYFTDETGKNRQTQSRYVLNASYLRLKTLQIGYTIPQGLLEKISVERARVYLSGENLLSISGLPKNFDPETAIASDPEYDGYLASGFIYPLSRFFSMGLNITF